MEYSDVNLLLKDLIKVKDPDFLTQYKELMQVKDFFKTAKGLDWDNIV